MDIKETIQLNREKKPVRPVEGSFIRTMAKDIAALQKPGAAFQPKELAREREKAAPPDSLPVAVKPTLPAKPVIPLSKPPLPPKPIPSAKSEPISLKPRPIPLKPEPIPLKKELLTRPALAREEKLKPLIRKSRLKFALIGLGIIIIIGGVGGFLYWWNYLRPIPPLPAVTHYECQDYQCISIEGEGLDQCQTDENCQPVEPTIPDSLIPVDETETIEINIGDEDLLLNKLKSIALKAQTEGTFKRVLVKLVSQTERKYADLETLLTALDLTFPDSILQAIAPGDVQGEDHTLFFYSQAEGNRLGILMPLKEDSLGLTLKLWETTIIDDLRPLHLAVVDKPAATDVFLDNIYQWVDIRYVNFPNPDLSIDYAVVNDKLIMTTSRKSMYAVIDALVPIATEATTTEEIITTEATTTEALE